MLGAHKKAYRELLSIGKKKHYENTILFREPIGYPLFKIKIIHRLYPCFVRAFSIGRHPPIIEPLEFVEFVEVIEVLLFLLAHSFDELIISIFCFSIFNFGHWGQHFKTMKTMLPFMSDYSKKNQKLLIGRWYRFRSDCSQRTTSVGL